MIVTDEYNPWTNMKAFVRNLSESIDPSRDIVFSTGPMDVLDHSATKFAFGSKMGIDATVKLPDEMDDVVENPVLPATELLNDLINVIPEITSIQTSLIKEGISVLILGVVKGPEFRMAEFSKQLLSCSVNRTIKFIVVVDSALPLDSLDAVAWYVSGNIDPKRDCKIYTASDAGQVTHLVVDGTRKTALSDGFGRDWPNPVVSSAQTIEKVDQIWSDLGLGALIPSPSLIYTPLQHGEGAISV